MSLSSFSVSATDDADRKRAMSRLRNDASFIGALSITLTLVMQYAYSFILKILISCGILSSEALSQAFLGLDNTQYLLFYAFVYAFSLLLPALMVSFLYNRKYVPFSPARKVPLLFALLLVVSAVGMCMLSNIINSYISMFFRNMGANVPASPQLMVNTATSFITNLFVIAVLPALLEEMIWRGYILRSLRAYGDRFAVVISALLFGLMHGNLRQVPFAFIVGLFLGFLYVRTNNIWIPIIVHFINNALSVVMEYVGFFVSEERMNLISFCTVYGLIVLGLLSTLILLIAYRKELHGDRKPAALGVIRRYRVLFATPLFLSAVFLYLVFVILGM